MTKTIFLKKSLESELKSNERFNGISTIEIPLKEEQSTHIYQSSGNYIADHLGQIVLTFSNETAWYWNKDLELTLKIGSKDGELKPITLEESGEYSLIRNGDEVEISKNGDTFLIKNIKKRFNLGVNLNTGDIISWNINVLNKNSIDFKAEFKIDYLKILKKTLERNVDNEKVELLNKELKLKKQTINEYKTITYELNTKINSEKILKEHYEDSDTGISGKYSYYISVLVTDSNISKRSNTVSINIKDIFPPAIPLNLHIFKSSDGLMLSWKNVNDKDLSHYKIYRREDSNTEFTIIGSEVKENRYLDKTVKKGKNYFYYITSVDNNRNESDESNKISEHF